MDFEKLFKFGIEYFSDYFRVFVLTLRAPKLYFPPKSVTASKKKHSETEVDKQDSEIEKAINPGLFGFVLISILIGTAIGSLARGLDYSFNFPSVIILIVSWFIYCFIFHIICKLLRGTGTFIETLSVGLQVFGVVYVISNFAEFA
ncbi:MAG: hypothetical protein HXY35_14485 [Chloroflexi bacterium]|nr:hypothetical protein [Chloroflexota bacterium]